MLFERIFKLSPFYTKTVNKIKENLEFKKTPVISFIQFSSLYTYMTDTFVCFSFKFLITKDNRFLYIVASCLLSP